MGDTGRYDVSFFVKKKEKVPFLLGICFSASNAAENKWYRFPPNLRDMKLHPILESKIGTINQAADNGHRTIKLKLTLEQIEQYFSAEKESFVFNSVELIREQNQGEILENDEMSIASCKSKLLIYLNNCNFCFVFRGFLLCFFLHF